MWTADNFPDFDHEDIFDDYDSSYYWDTDIQQSNVVTTETNPESTPGPQQEILFRILVRIWPDQQYSSTFLATFKQLSSKIPALC